MGTFGRMLFNVQKKEEQTPDELKCCMCDADGIIRVKSGNGVENLCSYHDKINEEAKWKK